MDNSRCINYFVNNFRHLLCLLGCMVWCLVGLGCGKDVPYRENAENFATSIIAELDEKVASLSQESQVEEEKQTISFLEACRKAATADPKILAVLSEIQKSRIGVVEAASHRMPRLSVQIQAELPIDEDYAEEFDLTGGLYFKYDVWQAIAVPDETALRRAIMEKNLQQLHLHLNGVVGEVSRHLSTLSLIDYKIKKKTVSLAEARKGLELVELYAKQNRAEGFDLLTWKRKIHTLTGELKQLGQARREKFDSFLTLLGSAIDEEVSIPDSETMLAQPLDVPADLPAPSEVWARHSEARLAEVEYVAAEVNIKLTQMEGLPKLNASLGVGSIPLTSNDGDARSLFQLSMSMPLWDVGDQERKMAKAKIERNVVKERMQLKAVSLWRRAKRAQLLYEDSLEYSHHLKNISLDSAAYYRGREMLAAENRLDSLDIMSDRIEITESVIMEQEADFKIREAAANYRFAIGYDVIENIIPSLEQSLLQYSGSLNEDGIGNDIE